MPVAKARYTGRMRGQTYRAPSGETINLAPPHQDRWTEIENVEDAEFLERKSGVDVEYLARSKVQKLVSGVADSISDALDALDYSEKQDAVTDHDEIDVAGNASEDEMDQAIEEYLESIN